MLVFSVIAACDGDSASRRARERTLPRGDALATIVNDNIDHLPVPEPSGIEWCESRNSLFMVGDGGDLAEIPLQEGTGRIEHTDLGDLEGIAVHPAGDVLYVIVENTATIFEIDVDSFEVVRQFEWANEAERARLFPERNGAAEGLAYIDDDTFYICRQGTLEEGGDLPPALMELHVKPIEGDSERASLEVVSIIEVEGAEDFASLWYDAVGGRLIIVSDAQNALYIHDIASGEVRRIDGLPGKNQEGFAVVTGDGTWFIAQDSGGIIEATAHNNLEALWNKATEVRSTKVTN